MNNVKEESEIEIAIETETETIMRESRKKSHN